MKKNLTQYGARLERTRIEIGTGAPGYRWANGVFIIAPDGAKLYPPVTEREAREFCKRDLGFVEGSAK